ncbi:response regulator [Dankookia rubra]|uniref:Response regulator n=1 Tax=Dankookia rubra TaxID=1442381 RepID=A0A4R5Q8H6_9PROT|nr:response regulator [Dankookia rubra]TDH58417.1 response regulator [Dankookia rubra]
MDEQDAPLALVVEDEAVLGLLVEHILSAEGFRILHAATEAEAARHVGMARIDLAIVNLQLDGTLAGQRVIRQLRSRFPELPVVVISGFGADAPEADLRGLGGPTARLGKPEGYSDLHRPCGRSSIEPKPGRLTHLGGV